MNTLTRNAATAFFQAAKSLNPTAKFTLGFYKHYGEFRVMQCSFDYVSEHAEAVCKGMATVLDLESGEIRSFKIERLAFISIDGKVWHVCNAKGETPRVHSRHLVAS